jgi:hypothetical protein
MPGTAVQPGIMFSGKSIANIFPNRFADFSPDRIRSVAQSCLVSGTAKTISLRVAPQAKGGNPAAKHVSQK